MGEKGQKGSVGPAVERAWGYVQPAGAVSMLGQTTMLNDDAQRPPNKRQATWGKAKRKKKKKKEKKKKKQKPRQGPSCLPFHCIHSDPEPSDCAMLVDAKLG
ncbi:hypothetical protein DM02DRAFT_349597 [Periconia macrospinosa]|uniref:Uncharacterized protein n=1 Tax=Periconia macrospinosa TaxID=97972 RepID=A0A2V1E8Z2_9PLEO|nr:hypothetical protein DM02DRAFT_349597 [Periconia macrospinosa]